MKRVIGLEHLTMLDVAPPELVSLAAAAGFDTVGLRVAPVTPAEDPWPMSAGSPMLAETLGRCADTGVGVHSVEAITLGPGAGIDGRESVLETAAALGARYVNVICEDPDTGRFAGLVAALAELGRPYGVGPVIECTAWRPVWRLADAVEICRRSGGQILLDALHVQRCGTPLAEIAALDPALLSYLQLCDAPLRPPPGPSDGPQGRNGTRGPDGSRGSGETRGPDGTDGPEAMPRGRRGGPYDARLTEARSGRLLPGAGELPLASLLGALPADLLVSVEAPNAAALAVAGPGAYAARAGRAARAVAG